MISSTNKKRTFARLKGIQESKHYYNSTFLHQLENSLQIKYNNYLKIENDYRKLRARISWLKEGDANTMFFHIMASNNKRKNKIMFFKNDTGNWINDPSEILTHIKQHFLNSFKTSHTSTSWISILHDPTSFDKIDLRMLDNPLMPCEVTKAIFSSKPFKAPGPDEIYHFSIRNTENLWGHLPLTCAYKFSGIILS